MVSDKFSGSNTTGSTAPLSLVSHLRGPSNGTSLAGLTSQSAITKGSPEAPVKHGTNTIYQEPKEEEEELSWPSPGTVRRADSRLDMAAKDLSRSNHDRKQATAGSRLIGALASRNTEVKDEDEDEEQLRSTTPAPRVNPVEGKRKWTSRASLTTDVDPPRRIVSMTSGAGIGAGESILEGGGLIMDGASFGRERTGPRLDDSNKRPRRPARPRSMVLSRSMTDPTALHSSTPSMSIADKEKARQWFLESDMDGWKVGQ
ncbi:hypothetical protein BGX29_011303 [Mortierella sp. GBA35]|nr:hypothetical protein BGX29_011303 [Mortierella sp. GBA35]